MTTNYGALWNPKDHKEAKLMVDASGRSEWNFWLHGFFTAARIMEFCPENATHVLDYGCGVGRVLKYIPIANKYGVDVSKQMWEYANRNVSDARIYVCDGRTLTFPDETFDFVYSILVLQHIETQDVKGILAETWRVLRPGGALLHVFAGFGGTDKNIKIATRHAMIAYAADDITEIAHAAGIPQTKVGLYWQDDKNPEMVYYYLYARKE